jgi:hypothetical protein
MPEWLLPRNTHPAPSPTESTPDKPDLVMLWEDGMVLKHQNSHLHPEEEDYQKLVYKTPTTASQKKLKILEICYTSISKIGQRKAEKEEKYAPLLERLIAAGYAPELYVIALGTSGEITNATSKALGQFGMKDAPLDTLLLALHKNAIHWLDVCIDTELALSRAATPH